MNEWKLLNIRYTSETSLISDNSGQVPRHARYLITYINTVTGELSYSSDLVQKTNKRNKFISNFQQVYTLPFNNKTISIFSAVVSQSHYETPSKFVNTFTRKFVRKNIDILGYVWVRDIGDIQFDLHYHFLIATERVNADLFKVLFSTKEKNGYDVQFLKTKTGMARYIKKKKLYGAKRQRSHGKSRKFKLLTTNNHQ